HLHLHSFPTRRSSDLEAAEAELRHDLARLLGDHEEIVHDVLRLPGELLPEHRILRRDPDRASVEMTLAHHDAAERDQRRGREARSEEHTSELQSRENL